MWQRRREVGVVREKKKTVMGYEDEMHAQEMDESKVAVRKGDQMQLKLKVRAGRRGKPGRNKSTASLARVLIFH